MTTPISTKDRILDTAERLFAASGFESTSLRTITATAEVNLAAVHYHFQSKDALIQAVIARRVTPINEKRNELLDKATAQAGGGPVALEVILYAFLHPCFEAAYQTKEVELGQLMARVFSEPGGISVRVFDEQLKGVAMRFAAAIRHAVPKLTQETLMWRFFFTVGSMVHTMLMANLLRNLSGGLCDPADIDRSLHQLITFTAAGLRA